MKGVGQGVVDDVDLGIGQDVGVGVGRSLDAVFGGEGLGAAPVPGRHGDEPGPGGVGRLHDRPLGDARRAEDPDPQRLVGGAHPVLRRTARRLSALVRTSATGPSPCGASCRMVSCSRVYQPS